MYVTDLRATRLTNQAGYLFASTILYRSETSAFSYTDLFIYDQQYKVHETLKTEEL